MSTSESSCSGKKLVNAIVSSEKKIVLYLKNLQVYRDHASVGGYMLSHKQFSDDSSLEPVYSINLVAESYHYYYEVLSKVDKLLCNSVRGMDYKLSVLFEDPKIVSKRSGTPVGTVHIYSQDLISWYDGKNWHKLE
jgi:hypothetical protein